MISKEEVEKLARLARIELKEAEIVALQKDMARILDYVSQVGQAQIGGAPAQNHFGREHRNVFREDGQPHEGGIFTEGLLKQAPRRDRNYVKVKKILGGA